MIRGCLRRPQFVVSKLPGLVWESNVSTPWVIVEFVTPTTRRRIFHGEFSCKLATNRFVASKKGVVGLREGG